MIVQFLVFTALAFVSPHVLPGVKVRGFKAALLVALVFGLLNLLIGELLTVVLTLLSLPFSLGIFQLLVPTAIFTVLLKITDALLEPFELRGWWTALAMGFLFSLGNYLTKFLV